MNEIDVFLLEHFSDEFQKLTLKEKSELTGFTEIQVSKVVLSKKRNPLKNKKLTNKSDLTNIIESLKLSLVNNILSLNEEHNDKLILDMYYLLKEKKNKEKYLQKEKEKKKVQEIFEYWNSLGIKKHRVLNEKLGNLILSKLIHYTPAEILQAIDNYSKILKGKQYFWDYTWTLDAFLRRGLDKFIDFPIAHKNYLSNKSKEYNQHAETFKNKNYSD